MSRLHALLRFLSAIGLAAGLEFATGHAAAASSAQNVFVVVVDGLRDSEAFEDPTHQFIPCIWDSLRPGGSIYTQFYNWGLTFTTPGHNTIATGVIHVSPNEPVTSSFGRPRRPTFFEYYRKALGIAQDRVWLVAGKPYIHQVDYGLDPSYGQPYRARVDSNAFGESDSVVWVELQSVMDNYHPSLAFVNLPQVDVEAHRGDWTRYTNAIARADSIVYALWQKIQANTAYNPAYTDTTYRNTTALIVTTDHGRHDDAHGGFQSHGGICDGCRHIMFLGIGQGIRRGQTIDSLRTQEDICPTVGSILGFPTPMARGHVLREMLAPVSQNEAGGKAPASPNPGETRLTNTAGISQDPQICSRNGTIHVVWLDDQTGRTEVYYRRSTNGGVTWRSEQRLSQSGYGTRSPSVWADAGDVYVAWLDYRPDNQGHPNPQIFLRKSTNGGHNWGQERRLLSSRYEQPQPALHETGMWGPRISGGTGYVAIGGIGEPDDVGALISLNRGSSWSRSLADGFCSYPSALDVSCMDGATDLTWEDDRDGNYEIYFSSTTDMGLTWMTPLRLTAGESYSVEPEMVRNGQEVSVVWADNSGGIWRVYCRHSPDGGADWDTLETLTTGQQGEWFPDASGDSTGLYVVWSDYRDGIAQVYSRRKVIGSNTWTPEVRETSTTGMCLKPRATPDGHCVWMDDRDGNWEIYFKELVGRK